VRSVVTAFIILAFMLTGMLLGLVLRNRLPEHHTRDDSRDVMKTAAGMMATLVALIIGLLVSSAKNSFDTANASITQGGAKVITLDRILSRYGPEAEGARDHLRRSVVSGVERIWPADNARRADLAGVEQSTGMEDVYDKIRELSPHNDSQQYLKAQALQLGVDLMQSRWMLIEQSQNSLPTVFLVVLVFWLAVLFVSFGLLAPRNATAISALFICALSMSGAIFLILELNRPLEGTIKVSSGPLQKAISLIGK
jgi:Protein of unknown function (DUF4239)